MNPSLDEFIDWFDLFHDFGWVRAIFVISKKKKKIYTGGIPLILGF